MGASLLTPGDNHKITDRSMRQVGRHYNSIEVLRRSLIISFIAIAVFIPGSIVGGLFVYLLWKKNRPSQIGAIVMSTVGLTTIWFYLRYLLLASPLFLLFGSNAHLSLSLLEASFLVQVCGGFMLVCLFWLYLSLGNKSLVGHLKQEDKREYKRARSILSNYDGSMGITQISRDHPHGVIRLGGVRDSPKAAIDLTTDELAQHVFLPGASGSGKTTTLARITDGILSLGYGAIIVDCKGGGLRSMARDLANKHSMEFYLVDPSSKESIGYNPCQGDGADVANKLIGAFTYGAEGEVYKSIAMHYVPILVRGLQIANRPINLKELSGVCEQFSMAQLAREVGKTDQGLKDELDGLSKETGVAKSGFTTLQHRFGALLEGRFGDIFKNPDALNWDKATKAPSVTYIGLPATAASEDVELMGRVLAQDLKQLCHRRLQALEDGVSITPILASFDEFAALREATQITDLLLQARQAKMPCVISTQYLPEATPIKKAALQAGLLLVHRLEAKDAEDMAAQFGTRPRPKVTHQIDWETGTTEKGSVREVEEYVIHPNILRKLPVGVLAMRSVTTDRQELVSVFTP